MAIQAQRFFGGQEDVARKNAAAAKQAQLQKTTMMAAQLDEQRRQEAQRRMDLQDAYLREDLKELHGFDTGIFGGGQLSAGMNALAQDASRRMREANNPIEAQEILAGFKSQYNALKERENMVKESRSRYDNAYNGTNVPKGNGQQAVRPEPSDAQAARNQWANPFDGDLQVVNGVLMVPGADGQMVPMTEDPRFIDTSAFDLEMQALDSGSLDDWAKSQEVLSNIALDYPVYDENTQTQIQDRAGQIFDENIRLQNDAGYAHRDQILNYLEDTQGLVLDPEVRERFLNGDIDDSMQNVLDAGRKAFQQRASWNGAYSAGKGGGGRSKGGPGSAGTGYTGVVSSRDIRTTTTTAESSQGGPQEEIVIRGVDPIDLGPTQEGGPSATVTGWGVDHNGELTITVEEEVSYVEVEDPNTGETTLRLAQPGEQGTVTVPRTRTVSGSDGASLSEADQRLLSDAEGSLENLGYGDDMVNDTRARQADWDSARAAERQAEIDEATVQDEVARVTTVDEGSGRNVDPEANVYGPLDNTPGRTAEELEREAEDRQMAGIEEIPLEEEEDIPIETPEERAARAEARLDQLPTANDEPRPTATMDNLLNRLEGLASDAPRDRSNVETQEDRDARALEDRERQVRVGNRLAKEHLESHPYPTPVYGLSEEERAAWWNDVGVGGMGDAADEFLVGLAREGIIPPEGNPLRDRIREFSPEDFEVGLQAEQENAANQERGRQAQADMERAATTPQDGRGYPANTAPQEADTAPTSEVPQPEDAREPVPPGPAVSEQVVETNRETAQAVPEVAPQATPQANEVVAQEVATANTELTPEQIAQMTPMEFATSLIGLDEDDDHDEVEKILTQWDAVKSWYDSKGIDVSNANGAWCAAFVSHVLTQTGHADVLEDVATLGGTQGRNTFEFIRAKKFENIGSPVKANEAKRGDIVVVKTSSGYHVGFFAGKGEDGKIKILGGNQQAAGSSKGNQVTVNEYALDSLYSVRRPFEGSPTDTEIAEISDELLATTGSGTATR